MAISVQCASCGQAYRLNDTLAGRLFQCRQCGATMQAPALDTSFAPPAYQAEMVYSAEPVFEPLAQGYSVAQPVAFQSPGYGGVYSANPPGAPKARRRKTNNARVVWMAAGGGLLFGMALVGLILVIAATGPEGWITLLMAPGRERSKIRPITAPAEDPYARVVQQRPVSAPPPPAGPSPEPVLLQLVAAGHRTRNALAAIHDESSARRQEREVVAAMRQFGDLAIKLKDDFPTIRRDEGQRLQAIYEPQVKSISEQLKREFERVGRIPGAGWVIGNGVQFEAIRVQIALARPAPRPPGNELRRLQGILTAPTPTPANGDYFAQFPEREVVEIVVRGLPADGHEFVERRIKAISNCRAYMHRGVNNSMRVTIAPISDVRQLAAQIDFGRVVVLHASQSLLVVQADATKFPPPLAKQ